MIDRIQAVLLSSTVLLTFLPAAHASFLNGTTPLGSSQTIFTTVPVPTGTPAGSLLASMTTPYSFATTAGTTSGSLTSAVFQNPSGTLDFYYQVANSASSATAIARETNTNFGGFTTQVGFRLDGGALGVPGLVNGSVAPVTADKNGAGSVVGFQFNPPDSAKIVPGTASDVLVISTNATTYTAGNSSIIDGGTQTVASFQPSGVPEPASLLLMGSGLLALTRLRRLTRRG